MYNVVFRYTRETGGYHGILTWTAFLDEEDFEKWKNPEILARQEIVEEGITHERAIELTRQTPFACKIAASVQEATDRDGNLNPDILEMQIKMAVFAEQDDLGKIPFETTFSYLFLNHFMSIIHNR